MSNPAKIQDRIYNFSVWYLNTSERKLTNGKELLNLTPKTFDVLKALIEKNGKILSKDEILEEVWRKTIVEEGNLPVHIFKLRKALRASKNEPIIETVIGEGYRFVSRVRIVNREEWNQNLPSFAKVPGIIGFDAIAIFPLKNESGDEEIEYLADGITESLINKLSLVPDIKVIARNSVFKYKEKEINIDRIRKELSVGYILTGRIRVIGNEFSIGVELAETKERTQIWGTNLSSGFSGIFEMQETITREICRKVLPEFSVSTPTTVQPSTKSSESFRLYLIGKHLLNKAEIETVKKAISYFHESNLVDPKNAISHIDNAEAHILLYLYELLSFEAANEKIHAFLSKARVLDGSRSEYFVLKGTVAMFLAFDIVEAERNFRKAIDINRNSVWARYRYSMLLSYGGRFEEALDELAEISLLDPLSASRNRKLARIYWMMERFDDAIGFAEEALILEPNDLQALLMTAYAGVEIGQYQQAQNALEKILKIQIHPEIQAMIAYTHAKSGQKGQAVEVIETLKSLADRKYVSPVYFVFVYGAMGDHDLAFKYLEKAYEDHSVDIIAMKVDPRFSSLKHDPRFEEMLRKIGLPVA